MSSLPEKVRVVGVDLPIRRVKARDDVYMRNLAGYRDGTKSEIVLNADCSEESHRDTVLHEIMHELETAFRVDLEEEEVGRLARGFCAVLRDNPAFVAWLMEGA